MNPWLAICCVLIALGLLLIGCQLARKKFDLGAELSRKLVHMGMGLICASFPLMFDEVWPVFLLGALAIISLSTVRLVPNLRTGIGSSLYSIQRFSLGEIYFPLSVAIVWYISLDQAIIFSISVLVLAFADAIAALVGTRYGKLHYSTKDGYKSIEGSFSFFLVTFFCVHVPLLLFTDVGRAESLLIATLISSLVMVVEAASWNGLDNLMIPISVAILLNIYQDDSIIQMIERLGVIALFVGFFVSLRNRLKLDDASLIGASLFICLAFSVGGWPWLWAPLAMFLLYLYLGPKNVTKEDKVHNIHTLLAVSAPGLFWLLLFYRTGDHSFIINFNCTFAVQLCLIITAQWANQYPLKRLSTIVLSGNALAILLINLPSLFIDAIPTINLLLSSSLAVLVGSTLFIKIQKDIRNCPQTSIRWLHQGSIGFLASLIPLAIKLF